MMHPIRTIFTLVALVVTAMVTMPNNSAQAQVIRCEEIFQQKTAWFDLKNWFKYSPSLARDLSVKDLMAENGDVWLFRVNGGPYAKGGMGYYTRVENGVSTSLNPAIAFMWSPTGNEKPYIGVNVLIIKQNIHRNFLRYPIDMSKDPLGGVVVNPESGRREKRLNEKTLLNDIVFYDEVKVPVEELNVIAEVPLEDFKLILANDFYPRSFEPAELARRLAERYPLPK